MCIYIYGYILIYDFETPRKSGRMLVGFKARDRLQKILNPLLTLVGALQHLWADVAFFARPQKTSEAQNQILKMAEIPIFKRDFFARRTSD